MKVSLMFLIVALSATVALEAQPLFSLGLNLNWSKTETSDNTIYKPVTTGWNIYPRIGYMFKDVVALGITGGTGISKTTNLETDYSDLLVIKRNNWFVGPFVRLCTPDNGKVRFMIDCSMRYGKSSSVTLTDDNQLDPAQGYKLTGYYLEPAVSYEINGHTFLEVSIGNLRYTSTTDNATGTTSSGFYASLGLASISGRLMYTFGSSQTKHDEAQNKFK